MGSVIASAMTSIESKPSLLRRILLVRSHPEAPYVVSSAGLFFLDKWKDRLPRLGVRVNFHFPPLHVWHGTVTRHRYHETLEDTNGRWYISACLLGLHLALGIGPSKQHVAAEMKRRQLPTVL